MATPFITMTIRGVDELPGVMRDKGTEAIVRAALDVVTRIVKAETPGGRTKSIVSFYDPSAHEGQVRAVFPLTFLIRGAKAHEIGVRTGGGRSGRRKVGLRRFKTEAGTITTRQRGNFRALRFAGAGGTFFRATVQHPGVQPNPFMTRAAQSAAAPAAQAGDRALQAVLNAVAS
jgi:hypothetical protein